MRISAQQNAARPGRARRSSLGCVLNRSFRSKWLGRVGHPPVQRELGQPDSVAESRVRCTSNSFPALGQQGTRQSSFSVSLMIPGSIQLPRSRPIRALRRPVCVRRVHPIPGLQLRSRPRRTGRSYVLGERPGRHNSTPGCSTSVIIDRKSITQTTGVWKKGTIFSSLH